MGSTVTCSSCGAEIEAGARFCASCGVDVTTQQGGAATKQVKVSRTQQLQGHLLDALREATLGDYEILTQLGQGGMATVYLAHDIALDRRVAIKVMNPALVSGEGMVERFKLEARTAAGLSHPHIIPIYAVKETEDLLFFVMKFVEGRPLDSIIKEAAPLPVPMVRTVLTKVGEALGYAHRRGVVHRDIKPANIMIDTEGMPIVTDFGIAKVADKQGLTMTGATIGTPTYMSPEQCNALEITGASDQYSLGIVAYEMLTGSPLYEGDSVMTIMFKHVHEAAPEPAVLGPSVPKDVASAVSRMLQKSPGDRWPSIEDALPQLSGGQAAYDDSVRTALIEFAKHGENREILKRVSTPRSPFPTSKGGTGPTIDSAETVRLSSGTQRPTPTSQPAAAPKGRKGLWIGMGGLILAGAAVGIVLLRPFGAQEPTSAGPTTPGLRGAQAESTAVPAAPVDTQRVAAADSSAPAQPDPEPPRSAARAAVRGVTIQQPGPLRPGQRVTLRTTVTDANGRSVSRRIAWSSDDARVAQVGAGGEVAAVAPGTATITATVEGVSGTVALEVRRPAVASIVVAPAARTLDVDDTFSLDAVLSDSGGVQLPDDDRVVWASDNTQVATVDRTGEVRAVSAGTATISAAVGTVRGSARITVRAPAVAEPERPAATVDHRALIEQAIQDYARALESRDIPRIKTIYQNMPADRESALRDALPNMNDLSVTLRVETITLDGTSATADVRGTMSFRSTSGGGRQSLPADGVYRLTRQGDRWVITEIR